MYTVYKHTFPNGLVYIGTTKQKPNERWQDGFGYKSNTRMFKAIVKYGWDNIQHDILYEVETEKECGELEEIEIQNSRSFLPECGYNNTPDGKGWTLAQLKNRAETKAERERQRALMRIPYEKRFEY